MKIFIDADACPRPVRDVAFRAAIRLQVHTAVVANTTLPTPNYDFFETVIVPNLSDAADHFIVENVSPGDLVVTADVPLAARIVDAGAIALNPRGTLYTSDNVKERLATRDLMADLRSRDAVHGGPSPFSPVDKKAFADALDRTLTRLLKDSPTEDP